MKFHERIFFFFFFFWFSWSLFVSHINYCRFVYCRWYYSRVESQLGLPFYDRFFVYALIKLTLSNAYHTNGTNKLLDS